MDETQIERALTASLEQAASGLHVEALQRHQEAVAEALDDMPGHVLDAFSKMTHDQQLVTLKSSPRFMRGQLTEEEVVVVVGEMVMAFALTVLRGGGDLTALGARLSQVHDQVMGDLSKLQGAGQSAQAAEESSVEGLSPQDFKEAARTVSVDISADADRFRELVEQLPALLVMDESTKAWIRMLCDDIEHARERGYHAAAKRSLDLLRKALGSAKPSAPAPDIAPPGYLRAQLTAMAQECLAEGHTKVAHKITTFLSGMTSWKGFYPRW